MGNYFAQVLLKPRANHCFTALARSSIGHISGWKVHWHTLGKLPTFEEELFIDSTQTSVKKLKKTHSPLHTPLPSSPTYPEMYTTILSMRFSEISENILQPP